MFGPQFMTKLMMNPETKPFLEQPDFLAILRDVAADPSKLTTHIGDPRFQKAMSVGLGISFGGADGMGGMFGGGAGAAPREEPARRPPSPPPPAPEPEPVHELSEEDKAAEAAKAEALQVCPRLLMQWQSMIAVPLCGSALPLSQHSRAGCKP